MHKGLQPAHEWLCKGAAWKGIVVLTTVAVAENRYTRGYAIGRALVPLGGFLPHSASPQLMGSGEVAETRLYLVLTFVLVKDQRMRPHRPLGGRGVR